MATPYSDARQALSDLWTARWTPVDGVPVLWGRNSSDATPSRAAGTKHWLFLEPQFAAEGIVAYGGGRESNEREIDGALPIRVFAARGIGDDTQMQLLDAALAAFRSQRVGSLTMIGDVTQHDGAQSDDGAWWVRSAVASFLWRFRG